MAGDAILVENKKARIKFAVVDTYSAGIELTGAETKSLRAKQGSLDGARVLVRAGEAYLVGATIPPYQVANTEKGYDPARTRRLLLSKKEIAEIADIEEQKGLTIVPLEVYNNRKRCASRSCAARERLTSAKISKRRTRNEKRSGC